MPRLLLFNPSNDMALAAGTRSYTPPKSIQDMERRMADFPRRWAEADDEVLIDWSGSYARLQQRHADPLVPAPWGWSLALKQRLLRFGVPEGLMPTDAALAEWRELSSRRFAAGYLQRLMDSGFASRWRDALVGEECHFYERVEDFLNAAFFQTLDAEAMLGTEDALPHPVTYIVKSPWSSSGRGVTVTVSPADCRTRLEGYVRRQGGFVVDRFYNKVLDCALEFFLTTEGEARFLGFSVFEADPHGHYLNHHVESQAQLRGRIARALDRAEADALLDDLVAYHREALTHDLGGRYTGPLGIDMLVCKEKEERRLHPCVEINLRMNMGIIAILLQQQCPDAPPRLLF